MTTLVVDIGKSLTNKIIFIYIICYCNTYKLCTYEIILLIKSTYKALIKKKLVEIILDHVL